MHMQDREVVAAVVAGDPDGLAAAYDQFAAALYAYCHLMLPDPDAAGEAVRDTFLIAAARLAGLRDPDRLRSWLYAVARNECLRRLGAAGVASRPPKIPGAVGGDNAQAAIELPAGLRGQVLKACADNTPAGRANRASVAHRAGSFGPTGFPKAIGSPGPLWWRRVRRHPRAAAAVTALAAVAVAAGIAATLTVGGSHRAQASTLAVGGGVPSGSAGPASGSAGASAAPGHQASPANGQPTPSVTAPGGAPSSNQPTAPGTQPPSPSASGTSVSPSPSASSSPSPSPSATPTPTPTPTQGTLRVAPGRVVLTSAGGKAASGTFILSAMGGPVRHYTISVPAALAGKVKVSPASGSLSAGSWVTVTVTVTSKVAVDTRLTVYPGNITVTVLLSIKA